MRILGIDPGLANTGLAVIQLEKHRYTLDSTELVKTTPTQSESDRLLSIFKSVYETCNTEAHIDAVAIEKVFHNHNVTSSITTGKAIGACIVAAAQHGIPIIELTPQQVKKASGLTLTKANKENLVRAASGIFRIKLTSHHVADAALCGLAGLLHYRRPTA